MNTEKEKMLSGQWYNPLDKQLSAERLAARKLQQQYNQSAPDDAPARSALLKQWLPNSGKHLYIEPPFFCDYGYNITTGAKVFFNFNCVVLDVAEVRIGNNVFFGPAVQIYTVKHPLDAKARNTLIEQALPVVIEDDVWIGGGAILLPGISIGKGSVVAAGSVVTGDIPPGVVAAGNPCRVIKAVTEQSP
ncbi:sugar O-acetyltransferase [Rheinheimera nanhaiensis]|uniref:Maltose O-acetyltransferase n=1 Tax=Rheinheimera nanhaiensis E407-8 TaxID=562729 RepID=I1E0X7_9GAMM|nr:sugar O-acetyltransferase [Rheinheimera nanhaiensis]GAB59955.1 maltose O-acetyltransferase [Rheinheimera nanhaiensis E407-8]